MAAGLKWSGVWVCGVAMSLVVGCGDSGTRESAEESATSSGAVSDPAPGTAPGNSLETIDGGNSLVNGKPGFIPGNLGNPAEAAPKSRYKSGAAPNPLSPEPAARKRPRLGRSTPAVEQPLLPTTPATPERPSTNPLVQGGPAQPQPSRPQPPRYGNTPGPTQPAATSRRPIVFREHKVTDPGMNNMVVSTLLVPEGWKVEGGVTRTGPALFNMPVMIQLGITAPDGRTASFMPSFSFEFNHQSQGQKLQPTQAGNLYYPLPESVGQWMLEITKAIPDPEVTNFRVVSEEDIPEITKLLQQQSAWRYQSAAEMNQLTAEMGFGTVFDTQATKVVLQYDKGGKTIEEIVVMTWQYEVMVQQNQATSGTWGIMLMQSIGGPVGTDYLNDPALNAIFQSVRNNPQWVAEMNKYWREIARIRHEGNIDAIKTAGKISQIQAEGANAVNEIMTKGWRAGQTSSDRMHAREVDATLEQTHYQTPAGETVTLPSFYNNVYTDGNGRYLMHNDANYEPNTDPAMDNYRWQRVQEKK